MIDRKCFSLFREVEIKSEQLSTRRKILTPEQRIGKTRESNWRSKGINMTWPQYKVLLEEQKGRCAVCKQEPQNKSLSVDQEEDSNHIRGLLCSRCFRYLKRRDNARMAGYIARHLVRYHRKELLNV